MKKLGGFKSAEQCCASYFQTVIHIDLIHIIHIDLLLGLGIENRYLRSGIRNLLSN